MVPTEFPPKELGADLDALFGIGSSVPYYLLVGLFYGAALLLLRSTRVFRSSLSVPGHEPGLDGLRGLLAITVLFHHAGMVYGKAVRGSWGYTASSFYQKAGHVPVLLFFFLSGYLFWTRLLKGKSIPVGAFLVARVRRLYPAYLASLVALFAVAVLTKAPNAHAQFSQSCAALLRWLTFALPDGHFPDVAGMSGLFLVNAGVVWSLRYEWLFYFSLPLLTWFARGARTFILLALAAGMFFILDGRAVSDVAGGAEHELREVPLMLLRDFAHMMVVGFGGGILTAYVRARWRLERWVRHWGASLVSIAGLAVVFYLLPSSRWLYTSLVLLLPFACIAYGNDFWGFLSSPTARLLGLLSYSIYLFHGIVLSAAWPIVDSVVGLTHVNSSIYWATVAVVGLVTVAISAVVYVTIELRFLRSAHRMDAAAIGQCRASK